MPCETGCDCTKVNRYIKDAGFKGEVQYFAPHQRSRGQINMSMEMDYVFSHGWYTNIGILVNSRGLNQPVDDWNSIRFQLTPQNLMPTKWNAVVTIGKEFTPLLQANVSMIYSPGTNLMILLPSVKYSLASNLDFDLIWQSFYAEESNRFEGISHRGFIRVKWSF
jgi:hypothetical protein